MTENPEIKRLIKSLRLLAVQAASLIEAIETQLEALDNARKG